MKKTQVIATLILFSALLFSCSNNEQPNSNVSSKILPNIIYLNQKEHFFTYDGNKLVSIVSDQEKYVYTYTGDLITKMQCYRNYNEVYETILYKYSNGKLSEKFHETFSAMNKYSYITRYKFNDDGTVLCSTTDAYGTSYGTLAIKNGNLIKDNYMVYEYDEKNNPFKNILGINALLPDNSFERRFNFSNNNCVKMTHTYPNSGWLVKYQIVYNSNDYAIESSDNDNNRTIIKYF